MRNEIQPSDDIDLLIAAMPPDIRKAIRQKDQHDQLIEIILDLGRQPEARFPGEIVPLSGENSTQDDIDYVVARVGRFTEDNRAGIERTLHRISAIRNRFGAIIGLTCRAGRAIFGTVDILRDVIESGASILLLGRPGVGKTTLLRESARVLAEELNKRVIIVDTSNEIAGDGDIPHPGIGRARRMQVPSTHLQHAVMIEAVENHMPEVIVVDEIGTEAEAIAARTIAERGVQLVATAHGNNLENLLQNPTLSDLVGGIQAVTLSDEEARRRGTRKTILERKAPPTFHVLVEIQDRDRLVVHYNLDRVIDALLRGHQLTPELRERDAEGRVTSHKIETPGAAEPRRDEPEPASGRTKLRTVRIFTYGVSRKHLERAIEKWRIPAYLVGDMESADLVLTLKSQEKRKPRRLRDVQQRGMPVHVIKSNTLTQIENFLRNLFPAEDSKAEPPEALKEAEAGVTKAAKTGLPVELSPRDAPLRRIQHEFVSRCGLLSESKGRKPHRRVVVYPA